MSAVLRQSTASGDGDRENDRKESFHGTKVLRGWLPVRVRLPGGGANRRVKLRKRSQLSIPAHNQTLSIVAMRVRMSCPHDRIRCFKRNIRERRLRRAQRCGEAATKWTRANS